jgi:uncharacterized protein (DUF1697 family)
MPMADVRRIFVAAGARDVSTYIQTGNVLFDAPARETVAVVERVRADFARAHGEAPRIILKTDAQLHRLVATAPFTRRRARPDEKLYVVFLARKPQNGHASFPLESEAELLEAVELRDREVFVVSRRKRNGFFGFPNAFVENALGVPATSRNWSTVTKLAAVAAARGGAA